MKTELKRLVIYPKDVQRITGRSYRYSRLLLKAIKSHHDKQDYQYVTIEEFCLYTGIKAELVQPLISG
jgi:hypothetical protein